MVPDMYSPLIFIALSNLHFLCGGFKKVDIPERAGYINTKHWKRKHIYCSSMVECVSFNTN